MQQSSIQSQVEAIKKATQLASQTKESAIKFLVDAGIVKELKHPIPVSIEKKPK